MREWTIVAKTDEHKVEVGRPPDLARDDSGDADKDDRQSKLPRYHAIPLRICTPPPIALNRSGNARLNALSFAATAAIPVMTNTEPDRLIPVDDGRAAGHNQRMAFLEPSLNPQPDGTAAVSAEAGGVLTIDLTAIEANWKRLAGMTVPAECAAVVKADAYGCGIGVVTRQLVKAGCRT